MTDKDLGNPENESFREKFEESNLETNENVASEINENSIGKDEFLELEAAGLVQDQDNQNRTDQSLLVAPPANSSPKIWMGLSLILAIVLVIVLITSPFSSNGGDEAVATVNGVDITKDTLYNELVTVGGTQTLDNLITEQLIEQEVTKTKITITDADVTKELDTIKKNFATEEEFKAALAQSGMTVENLKEEMKIQVKIRKSVEPKVKVTDADIKTYFEGNAETFGKATLEASTAEIKELLTNQQISTLSATWLAELKEKAEIKNTLEEAKPTETTTETTVPTETTETTVPTETTETVK
jgi:foldase protein PrsA